MSNKAGNDTSELITGFGTIFSYNSDIRVHGSMFVDNIAVTGGVLLTYGRRIHISSSTFSNNRATKYGGVIDSKLSSCDIINSNFSNNSAFRYGGVIAAWQSTFNISNNSFTSNSVNAFTSNNAQLLYGGVMNIRESSFTVTNSRTFADNSGGFGGVTAAWNSSITIYNNMFTTNSASSFGGVMATSASSVNATVSTFANNSAASYGGVLYSQSYSSFEATDSSFIDNAAQHGGVIYSRTSSFNISGSIFINNSAPEDGGVMTISSSSFNIVNNSFIDNRAGQYGGVIQVERNPFFYIISSTFYGNNAQYGGVLSMFNSTFHVSDSHFINNSAQFYGGIICTFQSVLYVINSTFYHNSGSLYIFFYSDLYFYGFTTFENCVEPPSKGPIGDALIYQEGGAITSFLSLIYYVTKKANLSNNKARNGGAVLAIESAIVVYYDSEVILAYNRAISRSGGGISLYQSSLVILGDCSISHYLGMQGGGIHASSSFITAYQEGQLQLISNSAKNGGGVYLEKNSELYLVKYGEPTSNSKVDITVFSANNATYGGAVFVADDTSTGTCLPMVGCFFQTIAVFPQSSLKRDLNTVNIIFSENTAEYGSSLFGGLLDRCIPSPLAEIYRKHSIINNGLAYLGNISNITLDAISSPPVQVCFCSSDGLLR